MANDGPSHLLSLKVMRVSRPELATAWQPFYSSSPSFSAHSTASILSLQGTTPLPNHPKTLRDLTHASELLTLPASFGSIQLGETFSSCLCVNNEAISAVELKQMRVEMQTATTKVTLSELDSDAAGGSRAARVLQAGDSFEVLVHHEIKELGQHVLACTVTYRLPAAARAVPGAAEDANDPTLLTFRKFYKFAVTNPLSVKTKVHTTKSPSAWLSLEERDKMFLEVHIQNMTPESMYFEKMHFESADAWLVEDVNGAHGMFAGVVQPQDVRQYIYVLTPKVKSASPPTPVPGSVIPLGRLDISWRSCYGEPGRLLTSMLTRRIPFINVQQPPASALPPYLKRASQLSQQSSRPGSPKPGSFSQTRPASSPPPAHRPGSPFQSRPQSVGQAIRPQSPQTPNATHANANAMLPHAIPQVSDVEVNLLMDSLPRDALAVGKPFSACFTLVVVARNAEFLGNRRLVFAVQHLRPPKAQAAPAAATMVLPPAPALPVPAEAGLSPRMSSSGFSTPTSAAPVQFNYAVAHQKILDAKLSQSPTTVNAPRYYTGENATPPAGGEPVLPPPYFEFGKGETRGAGSLDQGVIATGASAMFLPPLILSSPDEGTVDAAAPAKQAFQLEFLPLRRGFSTIGGLRILLVEDSPVADSNDTEETTTYKQTRVQTLKEYDVVGEVWVAA